MAEPATPATDATPPTDVLPAHGSDPVGDRGRLEVADAVVRRVVEHAADTTVGTTAARRRRAGLALGGTGASARIATRADQVDVRVDLALAYPAPILRTVEAVRSQVREQVRTLTGYSVRSLDVVVSALAAPAPAPAPHRRTE